MLLRNELVLLKIMFHSEFCLSELVDVMGTYVCKVGISLLNVVMLVLDGLK